MGLETLGGLGGAALGGMAGNALGDTALMGSLASAINSTPLLVGNGAGGLLGSAVTSQGLGAGLGSAAGGIVGTGAGSTLSSLLGGGKQPMQAPTAPPIPTAPMGARVQSQTLSKANPGIIVGSSGMGAAGGPPISPQQLMLMRRLGLG